MRTDGLPGWSSVLAVVAHPDDESFGLGAVLSAFIAAGSSVSVLCLTKGEASTLHGVAGDLSTIRAEELRTAAAALGVTRVRLTDYPDGGLADVPLDVLVGEVTAFVADVGTDGLLVFDVGGITGHPDHQRATEAALAAARALGVGVLAWTLPADVARSLNDEFAAGFVGREPDDVAIVVTVDRTHQRDAVACHPSQAVPGSALWRRLELLGHEEHLIWLRRGAAD